jgi:hypothetical protein
VRYADGQTPAIFVYLIADQRRLTHDEFDNV